MGVNSQRSNESFTVVGCGKKNIGEKKKVVRRKYKDGETGGSTSWGIERARVSSKPIMHSAKGP